MSHVRVCSMPNCQTSAGCVCERFTGLPGWNLRVVPTPSPTATELALNEAKRHILILTAFFMENPGWTEAASNARRFVEGIPQPSQPDTK